MNRPASPCINVCRMSPDTGWCEGCHRTIDEIRQWGGSDDAARERILAAVAERREWLQEAGLGVDLSAAASKDGAQT